MTAPMKMFWPPSQMSSVLTGALLRRNAAVRRRGVRFRMDLERDAAALVDRGCSFQ
jgi:hypothetical protein